MEGVSAHTILCLWALMAFVEVGGLRHETIPHPLGDRTRHQGPARSASAPGTAVGECEPPPGMTLLPKDRPGPSTASDPACSLEPPTGSRSRGTSTTPGWVRAPPPEGTARPGTVLGAGERKGHGLPWASRGAGWGVLEEADGP